VDKSRRS